MAPVSKYERGVIWPTMELMVAIAKAFRGGFGVRPLRIAASPLGSARLIRALIIHGFLACGLPMMERSPDAKNLPEPSYT